MSLKQDFKTQPVAIDFGKIKRCYLNADFSMLVRKLESLLNNPVCSVYENLILHSCLFLLYSSVAIT